MRRRRADSKKRKAAHPWCVDHHNQIEDIWKAIRGNGNPEHGLILKVARIADRQSEILSFVKQVQGVFWKALPIAVGGALSAIGLLIWQVVKMLWEHGKL